MSHERLYDLQSGSKGRDANIHMRLIGNLANALSCYAVYSRNLGGILASNDVEYKVLARALSYLNSLEET